ncbi:baseplate J/gp47 family protein [Christensenellaceae bacterium OttesenSCG-928-M15]|nr:baseplate J/gp47 family protein [Christensenellaceae bacterium OttesenSCG-928-M15]
MLNLPKLDDQRFDETLERAIRKIPYINESWTDFNLHDPGVTLLELFVWYKQMQQYQLDQLNERDVEAMLKLVGIRRASMQPAVCIFTPSNETALPASTRLVSSAGVPFETTAPVVKTEYAVGRVFTENHNGINDVSDILSDGRTGLYAFGPSLEEVGNSLYIEIKAQNDPRLIALYIVIDDPWKVKRNAFFEGAPNPREILFTSGDGTPLAVLEDETHGLSVSGRLLLEKKDGLEETAGAGVLPVGRYIKLSLLDAGCEEMPRISSIHAGFARAQQQITLSKLFSFRETEAGEKRYTLLDMAAINGHMDAFVRDELGWRSVECTCDFTEVNGCVARTVALNITMPMAYDDEDNVRLVAADPLYRQALIYEASGLPFQRQPLPIVEGMPLENNLILMGGRAISDGTLRYRDYTATHDLRHAGAKDRVFEVDPSRHELVFGDNQTGFAPMNGEMLYVAALKYTHAELGSVTPGTVLSLQGGEEDVGTVLHNSVGTPRETIEEMKTRLVAWMKAPTRAVTSDDCVEIAKATPGLRIHQARALPLFDPAEQGVKKAGHTTVVAVPFAPSAAFPTPSKAFLGAVLTNLNMHRTVCTKMHVVGPVYIGVQIWAELLVRGNGAQAQVRERLEEFFKSKGSVLGAPLIKAEVAAAISEAAAVLGILALELRAGKRNCQRNDEGDMLLPPYAIAYLQKVEIYTTLQ